MHNVVWCDVVIEVVLTKYSGVFKKKKSVMLLHNANRKLCSTVLLMVQNSLGYL